MERDCVVEGTAKWTDWWIKERQKKLKNKLSETMSLNPFMLPIVFEMHGIEDFEELHELRVNTHLFHGHNTGFGKLIDEKILPYVFGTIKLDKAFRKSTPPYSEACFDEIDHLIKNKSGKDILLSLKASRWSIQLTMAVKLNNTFEHILDAYGSKYERIIVGVFYGKRKNLTDKYDILRGINRGEKHNVVDLTKSVDVLAGREFWSWLNGGKTKTQEWVVEGIQKGIKECSVLPSFQQLLNDFYKKVSKDYSKYSNDDGEIDWISLLKDTN